MHAAIKVGDVVLEWNDSSLVIPHPESRTESFVAQAHITHGGNLYQRVAREISSSSCNMPLEPSEEIDRLCSTMDEKATLLRKLAKLIVKYNRKFYYNVVSRNCQGFVRDALKELGIKRPEFQGHLEDHFQQIREGDVLNIPATFETHEDLDAYIMKIQENGKILELKLDDLQYLLQGYAQHHKNNRCTSPTCQFGKLNDIIMKTIEAMKC